MAVLNEDLQPSTQIVESMQTPRRSSTLSASELADLDKHDALVIESVSKHFVKSGGRSWFGRGKQKAGRRISVRGNPFLEGPRPMRSRSNTPRPAPHQPAMGIPKGKAR